jgi:hypothetical protein
MNSEDPSHDKPQLVVSFQDADRLRRQRKSPVGSPVCDHRFQDVLTSPLREDKAEARTLSDDEWQQRSVDNIMALLKANAELRALAVKLSDILAARAGWDLSTLEKAAKAAQSRMQQSRQN